jgi:hypothetical protein
LLFERLRDLASQRLRQDIAVISKVRRKAGIGDETFCNWRKKYAGLMPSEMKRLGGLSTSAAAGAVAQLPPMSAGFN